MKVTIPGFGTIGNMTDPEKQRKRITAARAVHTARTNKCWIELPESTILSRSPSGVLEDHVGRQFLPYRGFPEATPNKVLYFRVDDEQNGIVSYFERFVGE